MSWDTFKGLYCTSSLAIQILTCERIRICQNHEGLTEKYAFAYVLKNPALLHWTARINPFCSISPSKGSSKVQLHMSHTAKYLSLWFPDQCRLPYASVQIDRNHCFLLNGDTKVQRCLRQKAKALIILNRCAG